MQLSENPLQELFFDKKPGEVYSPTISPLEYLFFVREQSSGGHRDLDPPDPIPNSAVKRALADGSATKGRVRVGRRQFFLPAFSLNGLSAGLFFDRAVTIILRAVRWTVLPPLA